MLVIENANQILTIPPGSTGPKRGKEMLDLGIVEKANVWIENGKVVRISREKPEGEYEGIDAQGKIVLPGFVDPHTHPVFAGYRDFEFSLKLKGMSYEEITKMGGGISYTVKMTNESSYDEIFEQSSKRIRKMIEHGTVAAESKSGYGLNLDREIMLLDIIRDLGERYPIDLIPTFLLHFPPQNMDREKYIDEVLKRMDVISKKAKFADVFCDSIAFNVSETKNFLTNAEKYGLKLRMHADEIEYIGCSSLGLKIHLKSVDHALKTPKTILRAFSKKDTVFVLLPGTPFMLFQKKYANARYMIENNIPVALGTDLNPNCYTENIQEIITLAVTQMKMSIEEAISAVTFNAAYSLDIHDKHGSIAPGRPANLLIADVPSYTHFAYHFGINLIEKVIKDGKVVKI